MAHLVLTMKLTDNSCGDDLFSLTQCGDKGLGLVALVDMEPGQMLISEPAILRVTLMNGDMSSGASKDVSRQFSRY